MRGLAGSQGLVGWQAATRDWLVGRPPPGTGWLAGRQPGTGWQAGSNQGLVGRQAGRKAGWLAGTTASAANKVCAATEIRVVIRLQMQEL